jgi:hypothetical protein
MAYSIVKELTGEVSINSTTSGNTIKQMTVDACLFFSNRRQAGGVYVVDSLGGEFWLDASFVDSTQILPAAAVDFDGTPRDLYELLETSFFYNVVNPASSGGLVESNIIYPAANVTLTASDYIVVPTASIIVKLVATPSIGQVYKIYANNNITTISPQGAHTIIGQATVSIQNYSAIIVQYVALNTWEII